MTKGENRFWRKEVFKDLKRLFLERNIHSEEDFQKRIKISYTWIRAWRDLGRLCVAASIWEDKYSSLLLLIVIGCCVCEFSNCIVCWVVSQLGLT